MQQRKRRDAAEEQSDDEKAQDKAVAEQQCFHQGGEANEAASPRIRSPALTGHRQRKVRQHVRC